MSKLMTKVLVVAALISSPCMAKGPLTVQASGRFQLVQISEFRKDQYLVDTQTGQIWSHVCPKNDDACVWFKDSVDGVNTSHEEVTAFLRSKSDPPAPKPIDLNQ